jgi:hypothetical protein
MWVRARHSRIVIVVVCVMRWDGVLPMHLCVYVVRCVSGCYALDVSHTAVRWPLLCYDLIVVTARSEDEENMSGMDVCRAIWCLCLWESKSRKSTKCNCWVDVKDAVRSNGDVLSKVRDRPGKQWHGMPVTLVHTTSL